LKKPLIKYTLGPDVNLDKEVVRDSNGRRITERRAQEVAERTIAQMVGRPSLTGAGMHSPEVKARVPLQLKKTLQREAKRRGQTCSELVREALEDFLP